MNEKKNHLNVDLERAEFITVTIAELIHSFVRINLLNFYAEQGILRSPRTL